MTTFGGDYSPAAGCAAPIELTVPAELAGLRLDQALARLLPAFSRNRLARWVRERRVRVDGQPAEPRQRVRGGESVRVEPARELAAASLEPEPIALAIVHEDDALLVVDKPPGLVVHPGSGNWRGTLANALLAHEPALRAVPRAGIVHRLDKDTSGLLVIAKTIEAHTALVRALAAREVRREYLALAQGRLARSGKVEAPVGRHPVQRTRMAVVAGGRPAVTHYEVLERYAHATLLRCRLETGRTHQIRVHLAALGHPLVGDATYGRRAGAIAFPRQALHAARLALVHPTTGREMAWESPLPEDLANLIRSLRESA
jgi:23S rRNA pseudouridine1911/1915/1917 synthase